MNVDWGNISLKDLAGYLSEELRKEGIDLILVGGACVTIYSKNRYQSYDLDFITYDRLAQSQKSFNPRLRPMDIYLNFSFFRV